jgi:hypothetical protein
VETNGLLRDAQDVAEEDVVRRRAAPVAVEGVVDDAAADGREAEDRLDGSGSVWKSTSEISHAIDRVYGDNITPTAWGA